MKSLKPPLILITVLLVCDGGGVALILSKENFWDFSFICHICAVSCDFNYTVGAIAECLLSAKENSP